MKNKAITKHKTRMKKRARIRAKVFGTSERPRLAIFKSNQNIYAQLIDDTKGHTLASCSSLNIEKGDRKMSEVAYEVGRKIAEEAGEQGIEKVIFDRGGFPYMGNIEKIATAAREYGLIF